MTWHHNLNDLIGILGGNANRVGPTKEGRSTGVLTRARLDRFGWWFGNSRTDTIFDQLDQHPPPVGAARTNMTEVLPCLLATLKAELRAITQI